MSPQNRPNILYLHSHDTGRFIQPFGYPVPTPNLQKLAEQGIVFRQTFSGNPTCSPSRACLLTGQYAHRNGMLGLAHRGFSLNDYSHHLLHTLRKAGYYAALSGIQHISSAKTPWRQIGYDTFLGEPREAHLHAQKFLQNAPNQPFFLSVGFGETHREFPELSPEASSNFTRPPAHLPDTPALREDFARFKKSAKILDQKMGAVLDTLEKTGLAQNTLVICTTDHGIAFPRMKCNLTDNGIGVMLMMRGPGEFQGGKTIDSLISQIDIFPTLCDWLGLEKPDWIDGVSFLPVVKGTATSTREEIFAEVNFHAAMEPQRCIRTKRWKYIRRDDARQSPVFPNCDDSPSKSFLMANGWRDRPEPAEALYDLYFDPTETNNLVNDTRFHSTLADLKRRLQDWMVETNDPLLEGELSVPETAQLNDPNAISPGEPANWRP